MRKYAASRSLFISIRNRRLPNSTGQMYFRSRCSSTGTETFICHISAYWAGMRLKSISKCCYKRFLCGGFKVTRRKCFMTEIIARRDFPPLYIWMDVAFPAIFAGYAGVIIYNLFQKDNKARINIPWLLAIGVLVRFGWEAGLLLGGIRPAGFEGIAEKLRPLVINSLPETNLGMPYIYLIYLAYSSRFTEDMRRRGA